MAQLLDLHNDAVNSPLPFDSPDPVNSEDEDRFLAGLTRRWTQSKSFAGVPSWRLSAPPYFSEENHEREHAFGTINCLTSMNGWQYQVPFPYETVRVDLAIHAAAAALQLANLKMAPQDQHLGPLYSGKRVSQFPLPPDQNHLPWTQNTNRSTFTLLFAPFTREVEGEVTHQRREALTMFPQGQIRSQRGNRFLRTLEPWWVSYRNVYLPQRGCAGTHGCLLATWTQECRPEIWSFHSPSQYASEGWRCKKHEYPTPRSRWFDSRWVPESS